MALLLAALTAASAGAATPVVAGRAVARYTIDGGRFVPSYHNHGFIQEVEGGRLRVTVQAESGWTRAPFDASRLPLAVGTVGAFAQQVARLAQTRAEAVALVLQAVGGVIAYDTGADLAVHPEHVLAERRASCVGLANLAVAALESLAIPARPARGVLIDAKSGEATPHRWLEVFYPDAGWVFSDPTESVNYVSAYHVLLTPPADPDPAYDPGEAAARAPRLIGVQGSLLPVDLRPDGRGPLGERPVFRTRFAAAIVGRVEPPGTGAVSLTGRGRRWSSAVSAEGAFSFPGLEGGRYLLEAGEGPGRTGLDLSVGDAERRDVELRIE